MRRNFKHVHGWKLVGHGFGAVVTYRCTSCPEVKRIYRNESMRPVNER